MTEEEAIEKYEKITYDLSKHLACLHVLYDRVKYINSEMEWDGMFECDFEDALSKLGNTLAACVAYTLESKYENHEKKDEE